MSNKKSGKQEGATVHQNSARQDVLMTPAFRVPFPFLWLALAVLAVYLPTLSLSVTDLDDGIFINDLRDYNEHLSNIFDAFRHTIFNTQNDLYYRPVALDFMILNYYLANHGKDIASYHAVNTLLHLVTVLLLYKLLLQLKVRELHAFILALLFAVHPVLTEAVAWICARVETILAIFVLSFLITAISYTETRKVKSLALSAVFLLLALFTKETAVMAAPVAVLLFVSVLGRRLFERELMMQYGVWAACYLIWFAARTMAINTTVKLSAAAMAGSFAYRLPLIVQYIGKSIIPVNLTVFPSQEDTVIYWGIAGIALLCGILFLNKQRENKMVVAGIGMFFLFLLPVMIIPANISNQTYEYRLYLPVIGVLLLLSQTVLLNNKLKEKQLLTGSVVVVIALAIVNYNYQSSFADPRTFWSQAVAGTPHSSYANMMLAARIGDEQQSKALFLKAFELNPRERYVNYIYATMLQERDSVKASEPYLIAEKSITGYYKCDFLLARVALEQHDYPAAITYLETYLTKDAKEPNANKNLLLLYIETDKYDNARKQVRKMQGYGLDVPAAALKELKI